MSFLSRLFQKKDQQSITNRTTYDSEGNKIVETTIRNGRLLEEASFSNGKNSHLPKGEATSMTGAYTKNDGDFVTWKGKSCRIISAECGDYILIDSDGETYRVDASNFY